MLGQNRWTDTVMVTADGRVRKELYIASSTVTVNFAAEFIGATAPYAEIIVDGVDLGYGTPVEIKDSIPAGPHEIEFVRDGFRMEGGSQIHHLTPGRNRIVGRLVATSGSRP